MAVQELRHETHVLHGDLHRSDPVHAVIHDPLQTRALLVSACVCYGGASAVNLLQACSRTCSAPLTTWVLRGAEREPVVRYTFDALVGRSFADIEPLVILVSYCAQVLCFEEQLNKQRA